jgi:hypothetical protein
MYGKKYGLRVLSVGRGVDGGCICAIEGSLKEEESV